jgi:hypothetical protein
MPTCGECRASFSRHYWHDCERVPTRRRVRQDRCVLCDTIIVPHEDHECTPKDDDDDDE